MNTVISGIQPSGQIMIGNYLGAIKNWLTLQDDYKTIFTIVDLHSITTRQDPEQLKNHTFDCLSIYLACGIDPDKSTIFIQSHVPYHTQLSWILGCYASYGELNRMTQFKDKSSQHTNNINCGLFTYPILMAADILLYQSNLVPTGEDQKQHLELARNIAIRFNNIYGDIFSVPKPFIAKYGSRIMSLQDPMKKMSKSDTNANNYISLLDTQESIIKKIKRCVTDSIGKINIDKYNQPGITNLLQILSCICNKDIDVVAKEYSNKNYGNLKKDVTDAIIETLSPIQKEYSKIRNDQAYLLDQAKTGAKKANNIARETLAKVYKTIGITSHNIL